MDQKNDSLLPYYGAIRSSSKLNGLLAMAPANPATFVKNA